MHVDDLPVLSTAWCRYVQRPPTFAYVLGRAETGVSVSADPFGRPAEPDMPLGFMIPPR